MCRRFDLDAVKHHVLSDFLWLSTASPLLDQHPNCLTLIHNAASAIYERRLAISEDQWAVLTGARKGPLGRYFEALIKTVFTLAPDIEAAHFNVPVRDGGATKGEFDVLYKWNGTWHHLEMAIKYYIGVGDRTDPYNWHGPALRDNLGRKWHHMMSRQLTLADTKAAQQVLEELGIAELVREPLLLGRLFHPLDDWKNNHFTAPQGISDSHCKGWWMGASDPGKAPITCGTHWKQLEKAEWLSPVCGVWNGTASKPSLSGLECPTQFAVLKPQTKGEKTETSRGFVVPDDWGKSFSV